LVDSGRFMATTFLVEAGVHNAGKLSPAAIRDRPGPAAGLGRFLFSGLAVYSVLRCAPHSWS
jgi:hypothetical protein